MIPYRGINWNRQKLLYDATLLVIVVLFFATYFLASHLIRPGYPFLTEVNRSTSILAVILLHVVLLIGPLCRLSPKFLPLLYNRRHLGVLTFFVALLHAVYSIWNIHGGASANPVLSVFTAYAHEYDPRQYDYRNLAHFPYEPAGFFALLFLALLAATAHDFWQRLLGPALWKLLHMLIYPAYALVVFHMMFGTLQDERNPLLIVVLGAGVTLVISTHLASYALESKRDRRKFRPDESGFANVGLFESFEDGVGRVAVINKQRVAVFRTGDEVVAFSNICPHAGGPIGEGRVVDGCVTCPWHGWQFDADGESCDGNGTKIARYQAMVFEGIVWVNPDLRAETEEGDNE